MFLADAPLTYVALANFIWVEKCIKNQQNHFTHSPYTLDTGGGNTIHIRGQ